MSIERLFIAEKPSLAEGIALALGEMNNIKAIKTDGCWTIGEDAVTWFFGHMYEGVEPKEYGEKWATYNIDTLPVFVMPSDWKRKVDDDKKTQISKVTKLVKQAKNIVNCGDAGREGQLLVDEALVEMGINAFGPNVKRLWVQSLARKDMIAALNALMNNSQKENLYNAALARQIADFNHGMSLSRLYSILARNSGASVGISVGRVMTPTLRLVVDRDRERANFKAVDHFLPRVLFNHSEGDFFANWIIPEGHDGLDSEGRLIDKTVALKIIEKVSGKQGRIKWFKAETKFLTPPLPFSLSALQSKCGSSLKMTAKEVLTVAQSLYEKHKATTYPRSDCQYLPNSIYLEAPQVLKALTGTKEWGDIANGADYSLKSPAWNDAKVAESDHHAIVPTTEFSASKLNNMSDIEKAVFKIIAESFLAQFYPNFKYKALSTEVSCEGENFKATGQQILDFGWKKVYGEGSDSSDDEDDKKEEDDNQSLPTMEKGDDVEAKKGELTFKKTSPPPAFSDGSLIKAMANAHLFETNPEIRKKLKEGQGIGTEATRSDTIEKILKKNFLKRKGKNGLESTPLGQSIIDALPEDIKSLGMTALWETALQEVEKGNIASSVFMEKQKLFLESKVENAKGTKIEVKGVGGAVRPLPGDGETCPLCEKGKLVTKRANKGDNKGRRFLSCSEGQGENGCKYFQWEAKPIEGDGKPCPECHKGKMITVEYKNKEGKNKSILVCNRRPKCEHIERPDAIKNFELLEGDGKECSKCHKGQMKTIPYRDRTTKEVKRFLKCNNTECGDVEFPRMKVDPMDGDGDECVKCHKGHMKTIGYKDKKTGEAKKFLKCDNSDCGEAIFPSAPKVVVKPMDGDGDECKKCHKGHMKTIGYKDKKTGEAKSFLKCDNKDCGEAIFPSNKNFKK